MTFFFHLIFSWSVQVNWRMCRFQYSENNLHVVAVNFPHFCLRTPYPIPLSTKLFNQNNFEDFQTKDSLYFNEHNNINNTEKVPHHWHDYLWLLCIRVLMLLFLWSCAVINNLQFQNRRITFFNKIWWFRTKYPKFELVRKRYEKKSIKQDTKINFIVECKRSEIVIIVLNTLSNMQKKKLT